MSAVRPSRRRRWKLLAPFFEQNFQPLRIGRLREPERLLTGHLEPIVAGSRFPTPQFHVRSTAGHVIWSRPTARKFALVCDVYLKSHCKKGSKRDRDTRVVA
jgi:hypothetical protein